MVIFEREPEALTPRQRSLFWIAAAVTAVSRWLAMSRTLWDWDENLFILAMRAFDVSKHHPHPPGFPLFIASAKMFEALGFSPFHALQAVNLVAGVLLFPAMFAFTRELRARFATSMTAALLLACFPNVWFFGGTGFSDVPSIVIVVGAAALLLRGCRSAGAYFAGAILAAVSLGYRPQNLAVIAIPFAIASYVQLRRRAVLRVVAATAIAVAIVAISYGAAVHLSGGWASYHHAVEAHQKYIVSVDSFLSPTRPKLLGVVDDFFLRPYRAPVINTIVTLLVLISIVAAFARPEVAPWMAIACFGPLALMSFLFLDWLSASRFSIGYAPMMAILAADGLRVATRRLEPYVAAAVLAIIVIWTFPALREAHTRVSPPVAAAAWLRAHYPPSTTNVYVEEGLNPHAEVLLGDYRRTEVFADHLPPSVVDDPHGIIYDEMPLLVPDAHIERRPKPRLWYIARRRYFAASVAPVRELMTFSPEWVHGTVAHHGFVLLPPIEHAAKVSLDLRSASPVSVTLTFNGRMLERFTMTGEARRTYYVLSRSRANNELAFDVDGPITLVTIGWSDKT